MSKRAAAISFILLFACNVTATPVTGEIIKTDIVTISVERQHQVVEPNSNSVLAVHFELAKDWHFYASAETAPGGMSLKLKPSADVEDAISFSKAIFPQSESYFDKTLNIKLEVFSDKFTVFLPFSVEPILLRTGLGFSAAINIGIEGAVCSNIQCRMPDFGRLKTQVKIAYEPAMGEPKFLLPDLAEAAQAGVPPSRSQWSNYSAWFALILAFLAGLVLNIMPCVLPVIPLKVLSIFEQARESKARCIALGLSFCLGILLFFAALAVLNIVLRLGYGTAFQWGDHFRNPAFLVGMSLLLVVLALFMFGVFTVTVPSSIAGKAAPGKGLTGSVAMGFLAAILSTPCSFAILTAAFGWAQTQKLPLATAAIILIGAGMAAPYAILTSMPSLLKYLPKAGRWTELFKQTMGFVLLIVAVWLLSALPAVRQGAVLYFAVILGFCVWMWGGWVSYNTKLSRKWLIRTIAVVIAAAAGAWLLPESTTPSVDWLDYDRALINDALEDQRPVLIEFMADWCLTCKAVEKTVYSRQAIIDLIERKGVLPIQANTTMDDEVATTDLKEVYKEPGVPVSILFLPERKEPVRLHGLLIGSKLKEILEGLPDKD